MILLRETVISLCKKVLLKILKLREEQRNLISGSIKELIKSPGDLFKDLLSTRVYQLRLTNVDYLYIDEENLVQGLLEESESSSSDNIDVKDSIYDILTVVSLT